MDPAQIIRTPEWSLALRLKLRQALSVLSELGIIVPSIGFDVEGVEVHVAYSADELKIDAGGDAYSWRIPLAWVMSPGQGTGIF